MSDASPVTTPIPMRCPICRQGCSCPVDGPGCEHYGCWSTRATETCYGVAYERARAKVAEQARRLNARAASQARVQSAFS